MTSSFSFNFTADYSEIGARIDTVLCARLNDAEETDAVFTRSHVQRLIEGGAVHVNNETRDKKYKLRLNDRVEATIEEPVKLEAKAENISLDVVYEDEWLLVVNKPKGMVVHPAPGNYNGTLVNALLYHCGSSLSGINGVIRPGIVHRIDKDTSGLLVVAKNDEAHIALSEQIAAHSMSRVYNAVVHGLLKEQSGTIDRPIGRSEKDRIKYCVTEKNSKRAVTHYKVIKEYSKFTHIELRLETGRTHQIRVHMASINHPVAGDELYGQKGMDKGLNGQCLHAGLLGFVHPRTGEYMQFKSELPKYFTDFLNRLD